MSRRARLAFLSALFPVPLVFAVAWVLLVLYLMGPEPYRETLW